MAMQMQQKNRVEFTCAEGKVTLNCDVDTPLGVMHDALMELKGWTVDRMIAAQKEEAEAARRALESDKVEPITQPEIIDHFE